MLLKLFLKNQKTGAPYGSTPVILIDFVGSLDKIFKTHFKVLC